MRTAGYTLRLMAQWAIITFGMSLLLLAAAGNVRLPSLRNYLVTFSAVQLGTLLVIDPGLVKERSRISEKSITSDRFAASITFLATLTFAALDVATVPLAAVDSFESTPGRPAAGGSRKHSANVGNGRQSVLLARHSPAAGTRTPPCHPWAIPPPATSGLSRHAARRSCQRTGHRFLSRLGPGRPILPRNPETCSR